MRIIPAIDLRGGKVVRLAQGDYQRQTQYAQDPVALAGQYAEAGATLLHIVDLDSAKDGGRTNLHAIAEICRHVPIPVQTGGGVRALGDVQARLELGAARVVVGSVCVQQPHQVAEWLQQLDPEHIVAGLDVAKNPSGEWIPRASGWTEAGAMELFELLTVLFDAGLSHLLCTDIGRDGMLSGPNLELYASICQKHPTLRVQASGGVSREEDLTAVAQTGAAACIVGRSLLEGHVPWKAIAQWSR